MWLKKGYDFVRSGKSFNDETAVVDLGVGKNMVASIKFWLKSFGIIDEENNTTRFGDLIFDDNGYDPFLEDPNTLWLLHFQLVHTYYATLYRQVFVYFHKERKEFSKTNIFNFIKYNRQIEKRRKSIRNAIFQAPEHSNTKSDRNLARTQYEKPSNETIIRGLPTFWDPLNIQFKLHVFLALKQAFSTLQVGLIYVDVTQKERD